MPKKGEGGRGQTELTLSQIPRARRRALVTEIMGEVCEFGQHLKDAYFTPPPGGVFLREYWDRARYCTKNGLNLGDTQCIHRHRLQIATMAMNSSQREAASNVQARAKWVDTPK